MSVEQTFENDLDRPLEAIYTFPLAGDASVTSLEVRFADRVLKGVVARRGDARREYDEAVARGQRAALVEQDRDDIFTVSLGNLQPGEAATVKLAYSELLPAFEGGETELRLPLVVASRYAPGRAHERAPDPPRLAPGLCAGVSLAIEVEVWEESEPAELSCTQHDLRTRSESGKLTVRLAREDELLDRDFVLRWRTSGARERTLLCVTRVGDHAYGVLSLAPPEVGDRPSGPREVVFLLDRSGSMHGEKLAAAREAVARMLRSLGADDGFAIATFSNAVEWFTGAAGPLLVQASTHALAAAEKWLASVSSDGGTELGPALDAALDAFTPQSERRAARLPVLVVVTDGQVGNEAAILKRVEPRLGHTRVFTLGIDSAVNAPFLRRLARMGRGTATLCSPGTIGDALDRVSRELRAPVVLDLELEDRGLGIETAAIVPQRLPDLWAGRHEAVFFKCRSTSGALAVRGRRPDGEPFEVVVRAEDVAFSTIAKLWARARVRDLEDREHLSSDVARQAEITELAVGHQILSKLTSFLVVDRERPVADFVVPAVKLVQPVEQPAGWARTNDVSFRRSSFAPADFRPGRIVRRNVVEARMHERDRWKRASTKRTPTRPTLSTPHAKWLRGALGELGAVIRLVLDALEAARWPDDDGAALARRRDVALSRLQAVESDQPLGPAGERAHDLLDELGAILECLQARADSPGAHVEALRAASKTLEECSRELANLLAGPPRALDPP